MSLSFSEAKLEQAIIELLQDQGYQHLIGDNVPRSSSIRSLSKTISVII